MSDEENDRYSGISGAVLVLVAYVALLMLQARDRLRRSLRPAFDVVTFPFVVGLDLILRFAVDPSPRPPGRR